MKKLNDWVITSIAFVFNVITKKATKTRSWFKFGTLMMWKIIQNEYNQKLSRENSFVISRGEAHRKTDWKW